MRPRTATLEKVLGTWETTMEKDRHRRQRRRPDLGLGEVVPLVTSESHPIVRD
jgi:hypothetical protein